MTARAAPLAVALLVAASAAPAAGAAPPPVALSATPARLELDPGERGAIALRNVGSTPLVVAARSGSVALDLRGRPRLVRTARGMRTAAPWLAIHPRDLTIPPGRTATLDVDARTPRRAEPGDHHAVVLLSTRPSTGARVAVRARIGVRIVVHVSGRVTRGLVVRGIAVRPSGRARVLSVRLENLGNVTESLPPGRVAVTLAARGRVFARLVAERRELLPHSRAVVDATYRGRVRGSVVARVAVVGAPVRIFRVRL